MAGRGCATSVIGVLIFAVTGSAYGAGATRVMEAAPPHFVVRLSPEQLRFAVAAVDDGMTRYGGTSDFAIHGSSDSVTVWFDVTVTGKLMLDVWAHWIAERTAALVSSLDFKLLSGSDSAQLQVAKGAHDAFVIASQNPRWHERVAVGKLRRSDTGVYLHTDAEVIELLGAHARASELEMSGTVIVKGSVKATGTLTVTHAQRVEQDVLEVCVMSMCPFAKKAEYELLTTAVADSASGDMPRVVPRFIVYKKYTDGKEYWASLHGESEIVEDLVQIVLRDAYPELFRRYLVARCKSEAHWSGLLSACGAEDAVVEEIAAQIVNDRERLLSTEYERVAVLFGVTDGSPTFVWNGVPVTNNADVPLLRTLGPSKEKCSGD